MKKEIVTSKESDDVKQEIKRREFNTTDEEIAFDLGVKWQKERSYSKEEVATLIGRTHQECVYEDGTDWDELKQWISKNLKK